MKYIINKGFITQKAGDQLVIFDSENSVLFTLNETASFIFNGLKKSWSREKIEEKLLEKFDIDEKQAAYDVKECIAELLKKAIIEEKF